MGSLSRLAGVGVVCGVFVSACGADGGAVADASSSTQDAAVASDRGAPVDVGALFDGASAVDAGSVLDALSGSDVAPDVVAVATDGAVFDASPDAIADVATSTDAVTATDLGADVAVRTDVAAPADVPTVTDVGVAPACPAGSVRIPGGMFLMGDPMPDDAPSQPVHGVRLSAYCMDLTEVTVAAYATCGAAGCTAPNTGGNCNQGVAGRGDHPINCVDWNQARAFCQSRGGDLPTEAQWEFAARGSDGRTFPWGSDAPAAQLCWSGGGTVHSTTCPVRSFPSGVSPFGLYDTVGNVWEWTLDWYGAYSGDASSYASDPTGVPSGTSHINRGGSFGNTLAIDVRPTIRFGGLATRRLESIGFRCAYAAPVAAGAMMDVPPPSDVPASVDAPAVVDAQVADRVYVDAADAPDVADAGGAADAGVTPAERAAFDTLLAQVRAELATSHVPGASVAVVLRGHLAFTGAAGVRDVASAAPVTTATLFKAGSMGKMVLAAAAMSVVRDGRLDVHAPITRYIPWFHLASGFDAGTLTLEHLLTHTSGFPCDTIQQCVGPAAGARQTYLTSYPQPLWAPPGSVFDYSNTGFSVASQVVVAAAGLADTDLEQMVHDRVFAPAGMTTATYDAAAVMRGDYATGYTLNTSGAVVASHTPAQYDCPLLHASGGVMATPTDYAHFAETMLAGGGAMLDAAGVAAMEAPHVDLRGSPTRFYGYGLVHEFAPYPGHASVWHDGELPGWASMTWMVPDRQYAVVVMVNASLVNVPVTQDIVNDALRLFVPDAQTWPSGATSSASWAAYTGTYNDRYGTLGSGVVVSLAGPSGGTRTLQVDAPNATDLLGHVVPVHGTMSQLAVDEWLLPDGTTATFYPGASGAFAYIATRRGVASR